MASKCAQMYIVIVLVHKSFVLCGFFSWPCLAVGHDMTRLLAGVFCEKMKFVVFEM